MRHFIQHNFILFMLLYAMLQGPVLIHSLNAQEVRPELKIWKGFERIEFIFEGRKAFITKPKEIIDTRPWLWRARFPEWHTEMDSILLSKGYHVAYVNTNNMFGNEESMEVWDRFYRYLRKKYNFDEKVALAGVSRGGLFVYNWALRNPSLVSSIYAEAPVLDFKSWPGGFFTSKGSQNDWAQLKTVYGFHNDAEALDFNSNPIDRVNELSIHNIPILHMIGPDDSIVPPDENSYPFFKAYINNGGLADLILCTKGKKLEGHHFEIETPQVAADFVLNSKSKQIKSSNYHHYRTALRSSYHKFIDKKQARVAFLGGSITYNGGWRDSLSHYLELRFSDTDFDFINAGIPSMGSTPSAFRLSRDILSKGEVDLVFVEAAVNDSTNGRSDLEQKRALEGIIRQLRAANANCDIVIMYFVDPEKMEDYRQGKVPSVIKNHETVAQYYEIPSIDLAKEVTERIDNGEFSWEKDFINLHPSPFGQGIYAVSMTAFLDKAYGTMISLPDNVKQDGLSDVLDPCNYGNGNLIDVADAQYSEGWILNPSWNPNDETGVRENYHDVPMLIGNTINAIVTLNFTGTAVGIAVAAGRDAGIIEYSVDGAKWKKQNLYTKWSEQLHLPWYYTLESELPNSAHQLRIRISEEKDPKSAGNACRIRYFFAN